MDNVIEELSITSLLAQMRRIPDDRYYYSIYATFEDGVLLGSWVEDNVIEYRTFISFDMLRSEQQKLSEEDKAGLQNMKELEAKGKFHVNKFTPTGLGDVLFDEDAGDSDMEQGILKFLDGLTP